MINYKEVQNFIEKTNNIKLFDYQIPILKAIIRGDCVYTPRGVGRSMLYNGYAEYLKKREAKSVDYNCSPFEFDSVFTIDFIYRNTKNLNDIKRFYKETEEDVWNKEYNCIYINLKEN